MAKYLHSLEWMICNFANPKEVNQIRSRTKWVQVFQNDGLIQLFFRREVWQIKFQEKLG